MNLENYDLDGTQRFAASLLLDHFEKLDPEEAKNEFGKIYTVNEKKNRREINGKALGNLIRERIEAARSDFEKGEGAEMRDPVLNEFCLSALERIKSMDIVSQMGLSFMEFLDDLHDELNR